MDPLAQLKDIQLPTNIHNYPIALGWWLLAIICLAFVVWVSVKILRQKKIKQPQKLAIKQLSINNNASIEECVTVLKWAALAYFPREIVANTYGETLHAFFIDTLPEKKQAQFKTLSTECLHSMYQKNNASIVSSDFQKAAVLWLTHALPPKHITTKQTVDEE